jgi:uncharacterized membrane protein required for colicin V production
VQKYSAITEIDWIILAVVGLAAAGGYRRGIISTALSLVGLVCGAIVGARMAPHFLAAGVHSRYSALVGLACAVGGVVVFQLLARVLAHTIRGGLRLLPPLRLIDSLGGLAVGAAWGLVLVWVVGAVALQLPGYRKVHREVRQSKVLQQLDQVAPPHDVLKVQKQIASFSAEIVRRESG